MQISTFDEKDFRPQTAYTAAALSMVPGLGQIYNGEARKGILFFCAGAANFVFLSLICLKGFMVTGAKFIGANLHVRLNAAVIDCLNNLDMRSPQMILLLLLLSSFTFFCIKDALEKRLHSKQKEIYSAHIMEISEAASGSYVLHTLMFAAMFLLVLFLFVPPEVKKQVVDITFEPDQVETRKPVVTPLRSAHNSENAGKAQKTPVHDRPHSQPTPQPKVAQQHSAQPAKPAEPKTEPKAEPQLRKPAEAKSEPKSQPKAEPKPPQPKAATEVDKPVQNSTPKPPTPSARNVNAALPLPMPMPAKSVQNAASPMLPQPTKTASITASSLNAPQPIIASSSLPSMFSAPPAPTASSSSGRTGVTPAPAAASSHHSTAGNSAGAINPAIQKDAGQHGGSDSTPQPVPSGGAPSSRTSNNAGGPMVSQPVPNRGTGHNIAPIGAPVMAVRSPGTGVAPDVDGPNRAPSVATMAEADYGPYMADLQRRIKRSWFPVKGQTTRTVVIFKIHKDGELSNLRLFKSSGDAMVDKQALKAVEDAAPFKTLPAHSEDDIDVQFTFDYNLFTGRGGGGGVKF